MGCLPYAWGYGNSSVMRTIVRSGPVRGRNRRITRSTTIAVRYCHPVLGLEEMRHAVVGLRVGVEAQRSPGPWSARLHAAATARARRCTSGLLRSRLTLPLPEGVVTTRASPSRTTQTVVGTAVPDVRKVVSLHEVLVAEIGQGGGHRHARYVPRASYPHR